MGIQNLIPTLQPYAERVIFGHDNNQASLPQTTSLVVIDGPSLIYHIYHRLLCYKANHHHRSNPSSFPSTSPILRILSQQPTYAEINHAVSIFLTYLQSELRVEIQKIYFDGFLPEGKRDVRLSRLEDERRKLVELRQHLQLQHQQPGFVGRSASSDVHDGKGGHCKDDEDRAARIKPEDLFEPPTPLPAILKSLPAPPFMVPAAIESLRSIHLDPSAPTTKLENGGHLDSQRPQSQACSSSTIIEVVPGEADTYCALYAARTGAAIMTSDSDLVAYDLGQHGSVIMLSSLELCNSGSEGSGPKERVSGMRYHPASLAAKMGISHCEGHDDGTACQRFCFERRRDPSVGTLELKRICGRPLRLCSNEMRKEYQEFLRQYSTRSLCDNDIVVGGSRSITKPQSRSQVQGLDPRLAELATQFESLHQTGNKNEESDTHEEEEEEEDEEDEEDVTYMYLPLLLEDPTRDSAWSYGKETRSLAYALLRHAVFCNATLEPGRTTRKTVVREYQRRGTRITDIPFTISTAVHTIDHLAAQIESILHSLNAHKQENSTSPYSIAPTSPPSPSQFWKSFALTTLREQRAKNGKPPPEASWTRRYLGLHVPQQQQSSPYTPTSWQDGHTQASAEAVLYSHRMLKQVAYACLELPSLTLVVKPLVDVLKSLPSIEEVMGSEREIRHIGQLMEETSEEMEVEDVSRPEMHPSCHPQQIGFARSRKSVKRQKSSAAERRAKKAISSELQMVRKAGVNINQNNMFEALNEVDE